jgi:hypothetical protein
MTKNSKRKLMFITLLLTTLIVSNAYAVLIPSANAAELSVSQKGLVVSSDVIGLDMEKYSVNAKEYPQDSYLGVLPQKNVRYTLNSNGSNVEMFYTFVNGKLLMLDVLENHGSPCLTKTVNGVAESAKDFLNSYQSYTGNSFYGQLGSSLVGVDSSKNSTKTVGNTKFEVSTHLDNVTDRQIFRWTYTLNGVEAPDKVVALGYENGFLGYFFDSWDLYRIGSTSVNVSEEEAIASAMERARNYSWLTKTENSTMMVKDFNVTGAMVWETVFRSSLVADTARNEDLLMLYPMRHVWVSLDKFYPGNVYGFNVYVWADTGEIAHIQERISTQDPPSEFVAAADDFTIIPLNEQNLFENTPTASMDGQLSSAEENSSSLIMWIVLPLFAFVMMLGSVKVWVVRKKGLSMRRFSKIGGILLCLLMLSMLMVTITTVSAVDPQGRAAIWTSRSRGAYNYALEESWRKSNCEVSAQDETADYIYDFFISNGYDADDYHGSIYYGAKERILAQVSKSEALYPRVAVVVFDHGNGNVGLEGLPSSEFHYMFEDDNGTRVGDSWSNCIPVIENAAYDYEIYPRTALGKVFFAFINTCNSAHISSYLGSLYSKQGIIPGTDRARGLPFAFTHLRPGVDMSTSGYWSDSGDFVYIGFNYGSAALSQPIDGSCPDYYLWVEHFFGYALTYDMSVSDALDEASTIYWPGDEWWETPLYQGYTALWPMYIDGEWRWEWPTEDPEYYFYGDGWMKVYGNGNIHLYQKGGVWNFDQNQYATAYDSVYNNDGNISGANWTTGKIGSGLSFDGSDDCVGVWPFVYDFKEITAEFWMKTSDTTKAGTPLSCSEGSFPGAEQNEFLLYNYQSFQIYIKGSSVSTGVSANDGDWHHIAVTWRSSDGNVKLYKDGTSVYSGTLQSGATINLADLIMGQEQDSFGGGFDSSQAFKGIMDEVRIYSYVLSAGEIADNAAVASFHLNGGEYAYDSSPYENTGTVSGASWVTGTRGYGLSFDGSGDYVNIPDDSSLDIADAVTVEAWIKPSRLDVWQSPLEKGEHEDWAYGFYVEAAGGNIGFEIGLEGQEVDWAGAVAPVNTYLAVGKWTHIVGTADSATGKVYLYLDGVQVDDGDFSGQINTNSVPFQIGKRYDGGDFGGVIDEVHIYNRALSGDEISAHYDEMLPIIFRQLTVLATDQYSQYGYVPLYIDLHYVGTTGYTYPVTLGTTYWIGVASPLYDYYQGHYYMATFQYFSYDSTEDEDNPMSLTITEDKTVTAHYYLEMLY